VLESSRVWIDIFFNNGTINDQTKKTLIDTAFDGKEKDMIDLFYKSDGLFYKYLTETIMPKIYENYKDSFCKSSNTVGKFCSHNQLAYSQWFNGSISANPTTQMTQDLKDVNSSYVRAFPSFSSLQITPELSYFVHKSGLENQKLTPAQVWADFSPDGIYNLRKLGDIVLDKMNEEDTANLPFGGKTMQQYVRFIMIQQGLGGLFVNRSPRELIEGYTDPIVSVLSQKPVWQGGDVTTPPFLSINNPPTNIKNNKVTLFTGVNDYKFTRRYALWANVPFANIQKPQYTSIYDTVSTNIEPWKERQYLAGTDGVQFHPDIQNSEKLYVWVPELCRVGSFDFVGEDKDQYPELTLYKYAIAKDLMQNYTENPANAIYFTNISGTANLTTVTNAPLIATKGHYYQFSPEMKRVLPKIYDQSGKEIQENQDNDDTLVAPESISGVVFNAYQRLFMNFFVTKDELYNFMPHDFVIPLAFVRRESVLT